MSLLANLGSPTQWFILIIVCLVIFGAKRLPDVARGLGKSLGEFKKARQEFEEELMRDDGKPVQKHISEPATPATDSDSVAATEKKEKDSVDV